MPHPRGRRAKAAVAKKKRAKQQATTEQRAAAARRHAEADRTRQEEETQRARRRQLRRVGSGLIGVVVLGLIGTGLWYVFRPPPELEGVERPPNLGRGHVESASYSSTTPTSGPHTASSPRCGLYTSTLDLSLAVHALEHGVVVLWYEADALEVGADLVSVSSRWDSHVIIAPKDDLEAAIVATAWNRRKTFESVTPEVAEFIDTYRDRGPESVSCDNT